VGDLGAEAIAVITSIGDERAHRRCERQDARAYRDVGVLTWREMKAKRPAARIAQRVDLRCAPAARASDRLRAFPLFRPKPSDAL
jgi:hypothetical protein